jgi:hypothetical protein
LPKTAKDHCQIASTNNTTNAANMANPIHGDGTKAPRTVLANHLLHGSRGQFIESYLLVVRGLTFDKLFLGGDYSRI